MRFSHEHTPDRRALGASNTQYAERCRRGSGATRRGGAVYGGAGAASGRWPATPLRIFEAVRGDERRGRGRATSRAERGTGAEGDRTLGALLSEREVRRQPRSGGRGGARRSSNTTYLQRLRRAGLNRAQPVAGGRLRARTHARLIAALGDPQHGYGGVGVVGAPARWTTTRLTEALLADAAEAVGAYLSPHVGGWSERIRIRGAEADFERAVGRGGATPPERLGATQFEILTAGAAPREAEVDVAVVEAGLGGRLDATNVLDARVVVLTNVALEHTDVLGDTRGRSRRRSSRSSRPGAVVRARRAGVGGLAVANGAARVDLTARSNLALAIAAAEAFLGRQPIDTSAAAEVELAEDRTPERGAAPSVGQPHTTSPAWATCCRAAFPDPEVHRRRWILSGERPVLMLRGALRSRRRPRRHRVNDRPLAGRRRARRARAPLFTAPKRCRRPRARGSSRWSWQATTAPLSSPGPSVSASSMAAIEGTRAGARSSASSRSPSSFSSSSSAARSPRAGGGGSL